MGLLDTFKNLPKNLGIRRPPNATTTAFGNRSRPPAATAAPAPAPAPATAPATTGGFTAQDFSLTLGGTPPATSSWNLDQVNADEAAAQAELDAANNSAANDAAYLAAQGGQNQEQPIPGNANITWEYINGKAAALTGSIPGGVTPEHYRDAIVATGSTNGAVIAQWLLANPAPDEPAFDYTNLEDWLVQIGENVTSLNELTGELITASGRLYRRGTDPETNAPTVEYSDDDGQTWIRDEQYDFAALNQDLERLRNTGFPELADFMEANGLSFYDLSAIADNIEAVAGQFQGLPDLQAWLQSEGLQLSDLQGIADQIQSGATTYDQGQNIDVQPILDEIGQLTDELQNIPELADWLLTSGLGSLQDPATLQAALQSLSQQLAAGPGSRDLRRSLAYAAQNQGFASGQDMLDYLGSLNSELAAGIGGQQGLTGEEVDTRERYLANSLSQMADLSRRNIDAILGESGSTIRALQMSDQYRREIVDTQVRFQLDTLHEDYLRKQANFENRQRQLEFMVESGQIGRDQYLSQVRASREAAIQGFASGLNSIFQNNENLMHAYEVDNAIRTGVLSAAIEGLKASGALALEANDQGFAQWLAGEQQRVATLRAAGDASSQANADILERFLANNQALTDALSGQLDSYQAQAVVAAGENANIIQQYTADLERVRMEAQTLYDIVQADMGVDEYTMGVVSEAYEQYIAPLMQQIAAMGTQLNANVAGTNAAALAEQLDILRAETGEDLSGLATFLEGLVSVGTFIMTLL